MSALPDDQRFTVVPDWICEILSPSASYDREMKLPIYARYVVPHVWLIDPRKQTVEVMQLTTAAYALIASFGRDDVVHAPPFEAVSIRPEDLWV